MTASEYPINPQVIRDSGVVERKSEEWARRVLSEICGKEGADNFSDCAPEGDVEGDEVFDDIMGGVNLESSGESKGFMFADERRRIALRRRFLFGLIVTSPDY